MTNVTVSIIPAPDTHSEYTEKLRKWKKDNLHALDSGTFADILKEVNERSKLILFSFLQKVEFADSLILSRFMSKWS